MTCLTLESSSEILNNGHQHNSMCVYRLQQNPDDIQHRHKSEQGCDCLKYLVYNYFNLFLYIFKNFSVYLSIMGQFLYLTVTFTVLSGCFSLFLVISFIHYTYNVFGKKSTKTPVDPLIKKFAFISLFGYTTFVLISFILYLMQSLYYIPALNIPYTTLICQAQTFNIVFFMMVYNA